MSIGENIHNYYEKMVTDALAERIAKEEDVDSEFLEDVACVALNHLPPRYYRHEIDMAFYLSPTEHKEMSDKISKALDDAIKYVKKSKRAPD
ncbi:MAG: late competence development ComFB family protein [Motiliproteus sp.]|nr:late competence development ComFB family protein [Motiliproteus sp.]MCW9051060.1 late competence development ComFB family protein [Motiliproteus sp.]